MGIPRVLAGALTALSICIGAPTVARAQSAENVAVVINDTSEDSRRIGEHYVKARGLPPSNVLRIQTTTSESIERSEFVRTIEQPLSRAIRRVGLQDRLLYLVLTKGVPLRVAGTRGPSGSVASVDSELTLLYRRMVGLPAAVDGRIDNPYYLGARPISDARPFTHREHDIYLVTRIDAYTVDQAIALIDRAQTPSRDGRIVLDQRGDGIGDQWMAEAAKRLLAQGHGSRVLIEGTAKPARDESGVLGYYSWGALDPANQVRSIGMGFAPGSIAAHLSSFDARTFRQPPDTWRPTRSSDKSAWFEGSADALVGNLIRDGVSGVSGQVDEAFAPGAVRPEILFSAYLGGFNLAEAFYLATPALSWQTVVIGDPLLAPFGRKPLSTGELEEPVDQATGYPALFVNRRSGLVKAANADVPPAAVPALLRSQAALDREDREGARRALEEVVTLAPSAIGPLVALAQLDEALGDYDAAISRYRSVVEVQPNHVLALNNLAYALAVRRNAPAEALPFARRAVRAMPVAAAGAMLDTLGWIEHLLGNNDLAAQVFEQAAKLEPGNAEIRLHGAIVYAAVGQRERAQAELDAVLRLDPTLDGRAEVRQLRERIASIAPVR